MQKFANILASLAAVTAAVVGLLEHFKKEPTE